VGSVRRAATWALRQIDDNDDHGVRVRVRPRVKVKPWCDLAPRSESSPAAPRLL
jgi:hypothetical protein